MNTFGCLTFIFIYWVYAQFQHCFNHFAVFYVTKGMSPLKITSHTELFNLNGILISEKHRRRLADRVCGLPPPCTKNSFLLSLFKICLIPGSTKQQHYPLVPHYAFAISMNNHVSRGWNEPAHIEMRCHILLSNVLVPFNTQLRIIYHSLSCWSDFVPRYCILSRPTEFSLEILIKIIYILQFHSSL